MIIVGIVTFLIIFLLGCVIGFFIVGDDYEQILERQINIKNEYFNLILDITCDYDGCNSVESLKELIDEISKYAEQGKYDDDIEVISEDAKGNKYNILGEKINESRRNL